MQLPILNELETYLQIKQINKNALVVVMTAYRQEMNDLVKQSLEQGAYACFYKPFEMDEVLKVFEDISGKLHQQKHANL